jgi:hypothetical protein
MYSATLLSFVFLGVSMIRAAPIYKVSYLFYIFHCATAYMNDSVPIQSSFTTSTLFNCRLPLSKSVLTISSTRTGYKFRSVVPRSSTDSPPVGG